MKRYGLRLDNVAIEFATKESRDKALLIFTNSSTVKVNKGEGPVYFDHEPIFGTYERETTEVLSRCYECDQIFPAETCRKRVYMGTDSWQGPDATPTRRTHYICDGCFAAKEKAEKTRQAKELLGKE